MDTNNYKRILFQGYSMYPFLLPGDVLLVKECPVKDFMPGNIAVYHDHMKNLNVAHRVIQKVGTSPSLCSGDVPAIKLKGDNLTYYDEIDLSGNNVIGKVIYIERGKLLLEIKPFLSRIISYLSRLNCTPGIIKSHVFGRPVKWLFKIREM